MGNEHRFIARVNSVRQTSIIEDEHEDSHTPSHGAAHLSQEANEEQTQMKHFILQTYNERLTKNMEGINNAFTDFNPSTLHHRMDSLDILCGQEQHRHLTQGLVQQNKGSRPVFKNETKQTLQEYRS